MTRKNALKLADLSISREQINLIMDLIAKEIIEKNQTKSKVAMLNSKL